MHRAETFLLRLENEADALVRVLTVLARSSGEIVNLAHSPAQTRIEMCGLPPGRAHLLGERLRLLPCVLSVHYLAGHGSPSHLAHRVAS